MAQWAELPFFSSKRTRTKGRLGEAQTLIFTGLRYTAWAKSAA